MMDGLTRLPIMLPGFHPLVSRWFLESIGEPTSAQRRGWDAIRSGRHTLIAAPTGSGKTLAAFLTAIDDLVREGCASPLADEVRVVYVSPLKALSADIHKNLAEPRRGIRRLGEESGIEVPRLTAAVRTGDTTSSERAAMLRTPPHILVTTPESLYLLLTAERSRQMLRTVRTVIVDEIHAVIGTRRGSHLALTLERLEAVCAASGERPPASAAHRPLGHAETDRRGRALPGRQRRHARRLRRHRRRTPAHDRPGHRGAALATDRGDGARGLGGVLRSPRRADRRAQDDARVREHAATGGARGATSERPARRRSGDRASRQPVEGETSRRRAPAEERAR